VVQAGLTQRSASWPGPGPGGGPGQVQGH
jgi:hypothetical protein